MIGNALAASDTENDVDNDDVDDDMEQLNKRVVKVKENKNKIEIQSTQRDGLAKDDIRIKVKFNDAGLDIDVRYHSISGSTDAKLALSVVFRELIEYNDLNGNGVYDRSIDQVIKTIKLDDFESKADYDTKEINDDTTLHSIEISTSDEIFTAHIYVVEEFEEIHDIIVSPTQIKIDIEINNFPFENSNSSLALYTQLQSKADFEEENDTEDEDLELAEDEKGIETKENGYTGFFTWADTAEVDGKEVKVNVSDVKKDHKDKKLQKIYLNYPQGIEIYHDPKIGIKGLIKTDISEEFPQFLITLIIIGSIAILSITIAIDILYRYQGPTDNYISKKSRKKESKLDNKYLTAVSEDFFEIVARFDMEKTEKSEFIKEMLALTPEKREKIIKRINEHSNAA